MRVLFLDGTTGFSHRMMEEGRPTGGICTSLNILPRLLAKAGHEVFVYNIDAIRNETADGVNWITGDPESPVHPDIVVYNRNFIAREWLDHFDCASILWLHDIPQFKYFRDDALRHVSKVVALSSYQKRSFAGFYNLPDDRFCVIENGVDKSIFHPVDAPRGRFFLHASAPVKGGLETVAELSRVMKMRHPGFEVISLANQSLHSLDNSIFEVGINRMKEAKVDVRPPVSQRELAGLLQSATALLMPNTYPENCSNLALQARACGCPIVASSVGSMADLGTAHGVYKTTTAPHDLFWYYKDFIDRAITVAEFPELAAKLSEAGPKEVKTWEQIASQWETLLTGTLDTSPAKTAEGSAIGKKSTTEFSAPTAEAATCGYGDQLGN